MHVLLEKILWLIVKRHTVIVSWMAPKINDAYGLSYFPSQLCVSVLLHENAFYLNDILVKVNNSYFIMKQPSKGDNKRARRRRHLRIKEREASERDRQLTRWGQKGTVVPFGD